MTDMSEVLASGLHARTVVPQPEVTRFEVIDSNGRSYARYGCHIRLDYQDGGRTLKVFVTGMDQDEQAEFDHATPPVLPRRLTQRKAPLPPPSEAAGLPHFQNPPVR